MTEDYRAILKRVGLVLVIVGALDIAYMIYCISQRQSYSSSLNVFAVVAGVFLWRGNLNTVRWVTNFAAFLSVAVAGALILLAPLSRPPRAWVNEFHLDPVGSVVSTLFGLAVVALFGWVYQQLRSSPVVHARVSTGDSSSPPKLAFALGAGLILLLAILTHFTLGGADGKKAVELARAQYGDTYSYYVRGLNWAGSYRSASVVAYNDREEKVVQVEW